MRSSFSDHAEIEVGNPPSPPPNYLLESTSISEVTSGDQKSGMWRRPGQRMMIALFLTSVWQLTTKNSSYNLRKIIFLSGGNSRNTAFRRQSVRYRTARITIFNTTFPYFMSISNISSAQRRLEREKKTLDFRGNLLRMCICVRAVGHAQNIVLQTLLKWRRSIFDTVRYQSGIFNSKSCSYSSFTEYKETFSSMLIFFISGIWYVRKSVF